MNKNIKSLKAIRQSNTLLIVLSQYIFVLTDFTAYKAFIKHGFFLGGRDIKINYQADKLHNLCIFFIRRLQKSIISADSVWAF